MAIAGDCKSPLFGVRRFESYLQHHQQVEFAPWYTPRWRAKRNAAIAQLVERIHGKDEVTGSSPVGGSIKIRQNHKFWDFSQFFY